MVLWLLRRILRLGRTVGIRRHGGGARSGDAWLALSRRRCRRSLLCGSGKRVSITNRIQHRANLHIRSRIRRMELMSAGGLAILSRDHRSFQRGWEILDTKSRQRSCKLQLSRSRRLVRRSAVERRAALESLCGGKREEETRRDGFSAELKGGSAQRRRGREN